MKNPAKPIFCLFLALFLIGCGAETPQRQLIRSMSELDRVYIPALIFTGLDQQRQSEIAFDRFRGAWEDFYYKYFSLELKYGVDITDIYWKDDFKKARALATSAEASVKGKKLAPAHENLESVRVILAGIRQRHGFKYPLDDMLDFDSTMKQIFKLSAGSGKLNDKDMSRISDLVKAAQLKWRKLTMEKIDGKPFGFDRKKVNAVRKRIKEEDKTILKMEGALYTREKEEIASAAQEVSAGCVVIYRAFGDFQPVFDRILAERPKPKPAATKIKPTRKKR